MDHLQKPARLQVDPKTIPDDDKPPQNGHTFNIWYLQWAGGDPTLKDLVKLDFRLDVERDSGKTKAAPRSPICLFYARGCCYKGPNCNFHHRPPLVTDIVIPTKDCFGRDKTTEYKEDMTGVGLLKQINRTLFVAGFHVEDSIEETVRSAFSEFGVVDAVRVQKAQRVAFVSFRLELLAQFAKEAMLAQLLNGKDILSIKWAHDDPNPDAPPATRDAEELAMETVRQLLGNDFINKRSLEESDELDNEPVAEDTTAKEHSSDSEPSANAILGAARMRKLRKIAESK